MHYSGQNLRFFSESQRSGVGGFLLEGHGNHFLITTNDRYERLRSSLPKNVAPLARAPLFLKHEELVVLAVTDPAVRAPVYQAGGEKMRR